MTSQPRNTSSMLRVILDVKCDDADVSAITSAMTRLRGVKHVEPLAGFDLAASIEVLGLSTRPRNALTSAGIATLVELTAQSRHDLSRIKNLGRHGLSEVEDHLKVLGLRLRPQTHGEITTASRLERERLAKERQKIVTAFNEVRPVLRRLWIAASKKGYAPQDWQDWQRIDFALRRYARDAAKHVGVEEWEIACDIKSHDSEPFPPSMYKEPAARDDGPRNKTVAELERKVPT